MSHEVDPAGLAKKILTILKVKTGSEIELSVLRNGSVLVSKSEAN
jgi:hypothetical protein